MNSLKTNIRLEYLFSCYNDKTITQEEEKELFQLLSKASDEELTGVLREEWKKTQTDSFAFRAGESEEMLNRILNADKPDRNAAGIKSRNYILAKKFLAAAAIIVIVYFGINFSLKLASFPKQDLAKREVLNDALPGGNKATLTLSNGKTINLSAAQNGTLVNEGNIKVNKSNDGQIVYQVVENTTGPGISVNTLSTPKGGQYQIVLSDGSKVWLNAASSLKFPDTFSGEARVVELDGEGYFEVTKNTRPFKVRSEFGEVEVLGTHFNVMAYDNEIAMKTTLLEGSVRVKSKQVVRMLKPGEQAIVDQKGMKIIDDVNLDGEIAWKNGMFQFNDSDIKLVMRQAARWYDLNVTYEGQTPAKRLTGKIPRNVNASELLNMLEYSGVNFKIQGKNIIVNKETSHKKP